MTFPFSEVGPRTQRFLQSSTGQAGRAFVQKITSPSVRSRRPFSRMCAKLPTARNRCRTGCESFVTHQRKSALIGVLHDKKGPESTQVPIGHPATMTNIWRKGTRHARGRKLQVAR